MLPVINKVLERDLDLLVLEEFVVSPGFRHWFLSRIFGAVATGFELAEAQHSVVDAGTGESDLLFDLSAPDGSRVRLLVENKVGAEFQPSQDHRYLNRASEYTRRGVCTECVTVIMAPRAYLDGLATHAFRSEIVYEDMQQFLRSQPGARTEYRAHVLGLAIDRARKGYVKIPVVEVADFWQAYSDQFAKRGSSLVVDASKLRGGRSNAVFLGMPSSRGAQLIHELTKGQVSLRVVALADRHDLARELVQGALPPGSQLARAGKFPILRVMVPSLDIHRTFADQESQALQGILAAEVLYAWWVEHAERITAIGV